MEKREVEEDGRGFRDTLKAWQNRGESDVELNEDEDDAEDESNMPPYEDEDDEPAEPEVAE